MRWGNARCSSPNVPRGGFTLAELLVTTALMALIGAATIAVLAGGIRVWERADAVGTTQRDMLVAWYQLRRDLQNVRRFHPVPFSGAYDACSFAKVAQDHPVRSRRSSAHPPIDEPLALPELGQLGYFFDSYHHTLCRSFVPYRFSRRRWLKDACEPVLERVERLRFSYFGPAAGSGAVEWSQGWEQPQPPIAVRVELTRQDGQRDVWTIPLALDQVQPHETPAQPSGQPAT